MLNRLANWALLLTCVAVVGNIFWSRTVEQGGDARENVFPAGAPSPVATPDLVSAERPFVLVFVQSSCRYCAEEMPFYRHLYAKSGATAFGLAFVGTEPEAKLQEYLVANGMPGATAISTPTISGLRGTPGLALMNRDGRVVGSWQGVMSEQQKSDLAGALEAALK